MTLVQELSAKDAGLTGRGYLWYRAAFIIEDSPWLGTGYFGFWIPENPDAVGFWRYFQIRQEGTAFSFHNSYIQTIVETGYLGLAVLVMSWGVESSVCCGASS
ncbi:O-antigen ligase family protein [Novosphingobium panipatense]|uniref:O-antigen ligase family protein n=1 Tax=Novosphingobium panipatense TaxID=428991 RepID=UPI003619BB7D